MGSQLLFYIGMTLVIVPLMFIIIQAIVDYSRPGWKEELHNMFMHFWNGTPEDELNAWYKVRRQLLDNGIKGEKLSFVDQKIADLDKSKFLSNTYVTAEGWWVEERNIRPYHKA